MKNTSADGHWRIRQFPALTLPADAPFPFPKKSPRNNGVPTKNGAGPVFYRRYQVSFRTVLKASDVVEMLKADPNRFSPHALALYRKTRGPHGRLERAKFIFRSTNWVDLTYDKLKLAQLIQNEMWTSLSGNLISAARGTQKSPVRIAVGRYAGARRPI